MEVQISGFIDNQRTVVCEALNLEATAENKNSLRGVHLVDSDGDCIKGFWSEYGDTTRDMFLTQSELKILIHHEMTTRQSRPTGQDTPITGEQSDSVLSATGRRTSLLANVPNMVLGKIAAKLTGKVQPCDISKFFKLLKQYIMYNFKEEAYTDMRRRDYASQATFKAVSNEIKANIKEGTKLKVSVSMLAHCIVITSQGIKEFATPTIIKNGFINAGVGDILNGNYNAAFERLYSGWTAMSEEARVEITQKIVPLCAQEFMEKNFLPEDFMSRYAATVSVVYVSYVVYCSSFVSL
jgi:hypothetical protein